MNVAARSVVRRRQAENHTGGDRDGRGEHQHPPIHGHRREVLHDETARDERDERPGSLDRDREPDRG